MGDARRTGTTAGEVTLAYLAAQVAIARDRLPGARRRDADAVHDLRVALRRMRAALQACRSVLAPELTSALVAELRWLGRELGPLRDLQVQEARIAAAIERLEAAGVPEPSGGIGEWFAAGEAEAATTAVEALTSVRGRAVLPAVDALLAEPPLTSAGAAAAEDVLPSVIATAARRARKRWKRARNLAPGAERDGALHDLRKAVKRLRYAAELSEPALGKRAARLAEAAAALQQVLGEHQDAVVARALLDELSGDPALAATDGFALGWLARQEHDAAEVLDAALADGWHAVRRAAKAIDG